MSVCIYHAAGMGPHAYLQRTSGAVEAHRAALYCQFRFDQLFEEASMPLRNSEIAALLIEFYGFEDAPAISEEQCQWIEMFSARESIYGESYCELMRDASLQRHGLDTRLSDIHKNQLESLNSSLRN